MEQTTYIETGIDQLLHLINQNQKLTVEEASQMLNVPTELVSAWAHFLENGELISISYGLLHTYLISDNPHLKEIKQQNKKYTITKIIFNLGRLLATPNLNRAGNIKIINIKNKKKIQRKHKTAKVVAMKKVQKSISPVILEEKIPFIQVEKNKTPYSQTRLKDFV